MPICGGIVVVEVDWPAMGGGGSVLVAVEAAC